MDAQELRQLSAEELKGRIKQGQEDLFRARFKGQSSEARDTSIFKKIRRDVARAQTVLTQKLKGIEVPAAKAVEAKTAKAVVEDKRSTAAKKTKKGSKA
ncbi:MAG: 50S ribosomal protein L29 [Proteobacteria bacterium]|nr:50S ribosomal protein L29 [Pseudomonadota bacterium]NDC24294.1 50S ribosomal protein L29 [Pseudomonadota bacterium]NDD04754.1 50S ribosomal protein L29 [Pseudomonadota bacterium]NDG26355.1 50S ribosomal protein L29 [Pseudomonadota bacterium]